MYLYTCIYTHTGSLSTENHTVPSIIKASIISNVYMKLHNALDRTCMHASIISQNVDKYTVLIIAGPETEVEKFLCCSQGTHQCLL